MATPGEHDPRERAAADAGVSPRRLRLLFFLDYDDGFGNRFVNSPGLLPLVGSTREAGFDVDFISSEERLLKALVDPTVDAVGISSMERLLPRSISAAQRVRKERPDVVLLLGGNAIDPFAVELTAHLFDLVVLGEGEHILPALLRAIATSRGLYPGHALPDGAPLIDGEVLRVAGASPGGALTPAGVEHVRRASFRRSSGGRSAEVRIGNVFVRDSAGGAVWQLQEPRTQSVIQASNSAGRPLPTLNTSPVPVVSMPLGEELDGLCVMPWDLFKAEGWKHFEFYTQRGCRWGRCHFCSVADRNIRAIPPAKVAEIIAQAVENGAEVISFADDLFVQHPDWNWELVERIRDLDVSVGFRAQTMPTRAVWPLLEALESIGFFELAYGIETLSPERAAFMAKSYNGERYIEGGKDTIRRTAAAGIFPVLYIIMTDPKSTLRQIAEELEELSTFVAGVYDSTTIVPKLSYSLMMLPVACTSITEQFEYFTTRVPLGAGALEMPSEFKVPPSVTRYMMHIDRATAHLPNRRDNLASLRYYIEGVATIADEHNDPDRVVIRGHAERALATMTALGARLERDADESAQALFQQAGGGGTASARGRRFDFRRFGGYMPAVERFYRRLSSLVHAENQVEGRG